MDKVLQPTIVLLILSLITEKIANFIKLQKENLANKFESDIDEKVREKKIQLLTIIIGIFIAIISKANLFEFFKDEYNLFWTEEDLKGWKLFSNIIGSIVTGMFLSLGSKFFHDLLDILYQIKNDKRILSDPETYKIDNIKSLENVLNTYQSDFIKAAYLEAQTKYMAMESVKAIGIKSNEKEFYFEITVDKNNIDIEPTYQYFLDDGTPHNIPIIIVVLAEGDSIEALNFNLSAKIYNIKNPPSYGTIGVVVRKQNDQTNKKYLLTCCHNVLETFGVIDKSILPTENAGIRNSNFETKIGTVHKAFIDHEVDAALIEITPENESLIINFVPKMGYVNNYRELNRSDEKILKTSIYGATTYGVNDKSSKGILNSLYNTIEIKYKKYGDKKITMMNLIQISNKALPGDSGSCVVDSSCNLLGLVVAGSDEVTYVMPIKTLLMKLNLQIA